MMDRLAEARDMLKIALIQVRVAGYIRAGIGDREVDIDPDAYVIHVMQRTRSARLQLPRSRP